MKRLAKFYKMCILQNFEFGEIWPNMVVVWVRSKNYTVYGGNEKNCRIGTRGENMTA